MPPAFRHMTIVSGINIFHCLLAEQPKTSEPAASLPNLFRRALATFGRGRLLGYEVGCRCFEFIRHNIRERTIPMFPRLLPRLRNPFVPTVVSAKAHIIHAPQSHPHLVFLPVHELANLRRRKCVGIVYALLEQVVAEPAFFSVRGAVAEDVEEADVE